MKAEIKNFEYDSKELKNASIDSLLAESGDIAKISFQINGKDEFMSLRVCGDIRLSYKNEIYRYPNCYPQKLIDLIKSGKAYNNKNIEIGSNNWVELVYSENGEEVYDFNEVVDGEFGDGTPLQAYEYLKECIPLYYKKNNQKIKVNENYEIKSELIKHNS